MVIVNTFFIKRSNGLFHYGMDYAEALGSQVREVWARTDATAEAASRRLPGRRVVRVSPLQLPWRLRAAARNGELVFTPSSHPLGLGARTVVVVHDCFPFQGKVGRIKKHLVRAGLRDPRISAAYVNRAEALAFLEDLGALAERMHYLPNKVGQLAAPRRQPRMVGPAPRIGLFGSDSEKKNYASLFAAASRAHLGISPVWTIYGHKNAYTQSLQAHFGGCRIEVVDSDRCGIDEFVESLDLAVSPAIGEGFARPVALALQHGVPTFLLDCPVFREFYAGSAQLFGDIEELIGAIAALTPDTTLAPSRLASEQDLSAAFADGVAWLSSL